MTPDIATLGIAVDSRNVTAAHKELDKLTAAAKPAAAGTTAFGKAAAPAAAATGKLSDSLRQTASSIAVMHGPLGGIASRFSSTASVIGQVGIVAGVASLAVTALSFTAYQAVAAFQQLEMEQATYNGVLRATGFAAARTADDIEALAVSVRRNSVATEGQVRSAAAIMLTFKNVTGEAFDESIRLSQDLAAVGFGSITSAAQMMGKALEDPILGLQAMRRVGVSFSETQKQQIKNFLETGQAAKAQQVILDGVRKQVGGAGAAQGDTLAGAWNQLGEATNNWLESTGATIAKAFGISAAIRGIASAIDSVNERTARAASPEGQLDVARRQLGNMESTPLPLRGRGFDAGLAMAREKVAAAELAVELATLGRAYSGATTLAASLHVELQKGEDVFEGAIAKLKDETAELRKTGLQREIDKALKEAVVGTNRQLSENERARVESLARERYFLREGNGILQARIGLLGSAASVAEIVQAKEREINEARRAGARFTAEEVEGIKRRTEEQATGVAQIKSSIDAARIEAAVVGMSVGQTAAYTAAQEALNEARRNGRALTDGNIEDIQRNAAALGEAAQAADNLRWTYTNLVQGPMQTFRSEIARGATSMEALKAAGVSALDAISKKLADMASQQLWEAAFPRGGAAGGGGFLGLLGGLFGGGSGAATFNMGGSAGAVYAKGGVPPGPGISAYSNKIITEPTVFAFAKGAGLMGEAGDEAVMPLIRTRDGNLGVRSQSGPAPAAPPVQVTIQQHNTFTNADPGSESRMRDWAMQTKDMAVAEAVEQVARVHGNKPSYLAAST